MGGSTRLGAGWAVNTILTLQSGRPVPVVNADDTSGVSFDQFPSPSNFHQRPNLVPGQAIINSNWGSGPDTIGYLNGNAFADPPAETFGTLGRNAIYGPHYRNVDFAITKNTAITERVALQLRAEFFNIFNHPNFALPNFLPVRLTKGGMGCVLRDEGRRRLAPRTELPGRQPGRLRPSG